MDNKTTTTLLVIVRSRRIVGAAFYFRFGLPVDWKFRGRVNFLIFCWFFNTCTSVRVYVGWEREGMTSRAGWYSINARLKTISLAAEKSSVPANAVGAHAQMPFFFKSLIRRRRRHRRSSDKWSSRRKKRSNTRSSSENERNIVSKRKRRHGAMNWIENNNNNNLLKRFASCLVSSRSVKSLSVAWENERRRKREMKSFSLFSFLIGARGTLVDCI